MIFGSFGPKVDIHIKVVRYRVSDKLFLIFLDQNYNSANKGWSVVNYCQSLAFDHPCLSCNEHCDWWFFQEIFFYYDHYYFVEILLNNLELVFLEFKHFYKTQRTSLFSFYVFIFYFLFPNHSVY